MGTAFARAVYPLHTSPDEDEAPRSRNCGRCSRAACRTAPRRPPCRALVYTPGYGNSIATRYDPVTLERSGPRVRLGGNASSWGWSPQREYLAVASYPQRLTVIEAATMRVVSRIRLAPGGGVTHAVTWTRRDRVLAVVDTPGGAVVATVDPFAGRVVRRLRIPRPFAFQFDRLPDGLVFLLGPRGRIGPAEVAVVDADGRPRVVAFVRLSSGCSSARGGSSSWCPASRSIPSVARRISSTATASSTSISVRSKWPIRGRCGRSRRSALVRFVRPAGWAADGWPSPGASGAPTAAPSRSVSGSSTCAPGPPVPSIPSATAFTAAGRSLLVEQAPSRAALNLTAYGFDGRLHYKRRARRCYLVEEAGSTRLRLPRRLSPFRCRSRDR